MQVPVCVCVCVRVCVCVCVCVPALKIVFMDQNLPLKNCFIMIVIPFMYLHFRRIARRSSVTMCSFHLPVFQVYSQMFISDDVFLSCTFDSGVQSDVHQ